MGAGAEEILEARKNFAQVATLIYGGSDKRIAECVASVVNRADDEGITFAQALGSIRINPYPHTK